jgi:hypothetical protein
MRYADAGSPESFAEIESKGAFAIFLFGGLRRLQKASAGAAWFGQSLAQ